MLKTREIDWRSPMGAFAPLAQERGAILLTSGATARAVGWAIIVAFPAGTIARSEGKTTIDGVLTDVSPFALLKDMHRRRAEDASDVDAPFASGLLGYAGYECGALVEPSVALPRTPYALPDFHFGAYDACAAFDVERRRVFLISRNEAAGERLAAALGAPGDAWRPAANRFSPPHFAVSAEDYERAVDGAIARIRDGEFYQANLSQRFFVEAQAPFDPFSLFASAAAASSAAYGAFLQLGVAQILSLSPERFFAVRRNSDRRLSIVAEPIKGTRPRSDIPQEDARLLSELMADPKDRAENIMIADLTRNDLSRICEDHTVREESICEAVSLASVHHLVSRISGVLREDLGAVDALEALFPCGSITGAPKIQAMKAIADIERIGRGPYCGAIGYLDDRGAADFSVAIRIAIAEGRRVATPVGGGVTLRSDPGTEYQETIAKARAWLGAFGYADWRAP